MTHVRLGTLSVLVWLCAAFAGTATAGAAPSVLYTASLAEHSHLGEGTVATGKLQFSGSEYHGGPYPLIGYTLRLPGGTTLSNAGFPTCSSVVLKSSGPAGCPAGSHAGPMTSFLMMLQFGQERVAEEGTVQGFFSPEGGVLLYFEAHSPVGLEFVAAGHYEPATPPLGPALQFELPLVETVPGAPYVSVTDLAVALGAFRTEAGHEIASVVAPGECPEGSFSWPARSLFTDGEGHETTVLSEYLTPCLPAGKRTGTSTTLMASKATPVAGEPDTYTATVTPETGGGEAPTGTVSFYDNVYAYGAPIPGCTAISLTANGASATAGCNATTKEGAPQTVTATYSGDSSYTESEALAITVTVTTLSNSASGTSTEPSTPATASNGPLSATTSDGEGTVTVGQYGSNPAGAPPFISSGGYIDAYLSPGNTFTSLEFTDCELNGGTSLYWWNPQAVGGGEWQAVSDETMPSGSPPCITVKINETTSPDLAQMTGTQFAVALPASPPSVTITTPAQGSSYNEGQYVAASYSCSEGAGGPGLKPGSEGCSGTVPNGSPIETSKTGRHEFKVTASSKDGKRTTKTVTYAVVAVKKLADIRVSISGPSGAADSSTFKETITVLNAGPAAAKNVITALPVPSGLSVTSSPGASEIHSILYWTDPLLAYGAPHLTYTVTFKVAPKARGNAYVGVAAFSATPDPNLLNNVALTVVKLG